MSKVATSKTDKLVKDINDNLERFGGIPREDGRPSILKNETPAVEVQEFDAVAFVRSRGIYNLDGKDEYFLREDCSEKGESAYSMKGWFLYRSRLALTAFALAVSQSLIKSGFI